jgi:hypothetical protein
MNEIAAKSLGEYFVFCDFSHAVVALTDTATESPFQPGKTSPTKTRVKEAHMVVKQTAVSTKLSPENFGRMTFP